METPNMHVISPRRTICEVLRRIHNTKGVTPEIQKKCIEATVMAKKMDAKLREYKSDWDSGFFQPNPHYPWSTY